MNDTNLYYYKVDDMVYAYDFNYEKVAQINSSTLYTDKFIIQKKFFFKNKSKFCINPHIIFSRFPKFNIVYCKLLLSSSLIFPILLFFILSPQNIYKINTNVQSTRLELLILCLFILVISNMIHELSHAIVGCAKGLITVECGIKLVRIGTFCFPKFYTISVGYAKLNKVEKNKYLFAGILANILLTNINCLLILINSNKEYNTYFTLFIIINICIVLGNLNVITNSDFYFFLENQFECYELRHKLINFLRNKQTMTSSIGFKIFRVLFFINVLVLLVLVTMMVLLTII